MTRGRWVAFAVAAAWISGALIGASVVIFAVGRGWMP